MSPATIKSLIAGAVGLVYAVIYGFWTILITGGGHGNFVWFMMFMTVECFGLYFPLLSVLAIHLRSRPIRRIFGALIGFNLFVSSIMLLCWVNGIALGKAVESNEYVEMLKTNGIEWILICGAAHFLPTIVFLLLLIRSIYCGSSWSDEDQSASFNHS